MPHKSLKNLDVTLPAWVSALEDDCLHDVLVEALVARHNAVRSGATDPRAPKVCREAISAADASVALIEQGRASGKSAASRAADAVRKYTDARACVLPLPARRGNRGSSR
jgi:hypothetical protein